MQGEKGGNFAYLRRGKVQNFVENERSHTMDKRNSDLILEFYRCLSPENKLEFIDLVKKLADTNVSKLETKKNGPCA